MLLNKCFTLKKSSKHFHVVQDTHGAVPWMDCEAKFEKARVLSLLSVEIQHILRYNLLIIMRGDCKLWGFFMCVSYKFSWGWELHTVAALEAASSFRTFGAARDELIVQKGYTGNRSDKDAKVKFIKHKFEEAGNANTEVVSEEAYKPWWILRRNEPEDGGTGAWSMPGCRIDWLYTGMSRVELLFCRKGGSGLRRFRLKIILLCFASQKQVLLVLCQEAVTH